MIDLLTNLQAVEDFSNRSKFSRVLSKPFGYLQLFYYKIIKYRMLKKSSVVTADTFWGEQIAISLPASSDIFLSGGKTHDSEVRLCRFLINNYSKGDFLDIGGHIGFFSLLASILNDDKNKIITVEPSLKTFSILKINTIKQQNITPINYAIGNENKEIEFFEFPEFFAENNTLNTKQFDKQKWYANNLPTQRKIGMKTGDTIIAENNITPTIIKIDVEGAENLVVNGLLNYLSENSPIIIMEFYHNSKNNDSHIAAENQLFSLGYNNYYISTDGRLETINSPSSQYLAKYHIESDNIVYLKN